MTCETGLTKSMILDVAVEDALQADPDLAGAPITVTVQGATVSLRGDVGSAAAKEAAEHLARGVSGVLEVINELVVVRHHRGPWPFDSADSGRRTAAGVAGYALGASRIGGGGGVGSSMGGVGAVAALMITVDAVAGKHRAEDTEEVKG